MSADQAQSRTFSEAWHRVGGVRAALRTSVRAHRQMFHGEQWVVLRDILSNDWYRVTAEALDSAQVSLNGHLLSLRDDGSLPPLDAVASPSLVLPPRSWAFVTLDDLPACH